MSKTKKTNVLLPLITIFVIYCYCATSIPTVSGHTNNADNVSGYITGEENGKRPACEECVIITFFKNTLIIILPISALVALYIVYFSLKRRKQRFPNKT